MSLPVCTSLTLALFLNLDYEKLGEAPEEPLNIVADLGSVMCNVGLYDD